MAVDRSTLVSSACTCSSAIALGIDVIDQLATGGIANLSRYMQHYLTGGWGIEGNMTLNPHQNAFSLRISKHKRYTRIHR